MKSRFPLSACDWFVLFEVGFIAVITYSRYRTDGSFEVIGPVVAILSAVIYLNYRADFVTQKNSRGGDLQNPDRTIARDPDVN